MTFPKLKSSSPHWQWIHTANTKNRHALKAIEKLYLQFTSISIPRESHWRYILVKLPALYSHYSWHTLPKKVHREEIDWSSDAKEERKKEEQYRKSLALILGKLFISGFDFEIPQFWTSGIQIDVETQPFNVLQANRTTHIVYRRSWHHVFYLALFEYLGTKCQEEWSKSAGALWEQWNFTRLHLSKTKGLPQKKLLLYKVTFGV